MGYIQNLVLKAVGVDIDLFNRVRNNPYYTTYNVTGGFRFQDFNQDKVIEEGYAKNPFVYSIVSRISSLASTIPLKLYDVKQDGEKELITDGEYYNLLQQPNRLQTGEALTNEALTYLLLTGNTYVNGYRAEGMGDVFRELNVLPSNFTTIETGGINEPVKAYWYQEVNNIKFDVDNVMHTKYTNVKGTGADRLYGLSPLEAGNTAMQSSSNIYDAKGNIIKNTGPNGIISSNSERSLHKEEAEQMQELWDKKSSNTAKYGRNLVTSANVNFTPIGLSPDKLQLLEGAVGDLRALCSVYSCPSQLFGDVQSTTYDNMTLAKKAIYTDAVLPNLNLYLKDFNNWCSVSWSKHDNKNYCVEADTSSIEALQEDQREEAEKDKVVADTIINVLNSNTSNESKVNTLVYSIGMSEEEAISIVGTEETNDVGTE